MTGVCLLTRTVRSLQIFGPSNIRFIRVSGSSSQEVGYSDQICPFSSGWGGFTIDIDVEWKDATHSSQAYILTLANDGWPTKSAPAEFRSVEVEAVYRSLFSDKYRWRKAETVARITRLPEGRVREILKKAGEGAVSQKHTPCFIRDKGALGPDCNCRAFASSLIVFGRFA